MKDGPVNVVWLEGQNCTGNTTALLEAQEPGLVQVLLGGTPLIGPGSVRLIFHESVLVPWGAFHVADPLDVNREKVLEEYLREQVFPGDLNRTLQEIADGKHGPYVLVLEGSLPQEKFIPGSNIEGEGFYCKIGTRTCTEWFKELLKNAIAVVGVGNCATYGGFVANKVLEPPPGFKYATWSQSPTGAVGIFDDPYKGIKGALHLDYFQPYIEPFRKYIDEGGVPDFKTKKPAVAVSGCPANGDAILRTLAVLVLVAAGYMKPEVLDRDSFLDEHGRPRFIFQHTVHEQCPRAAWYAIGDFRPYPGALDAKCLYAVGCKGPASHCPWNKIGWVGGIGGPTRTGGVCIGCTMPGFTDAWEPFYAKLPYVPGAAPHIQNAAVAIGVGSLAAAAVAGALVGIRERGRERKAAEEEKRGEERK